MKGARSRGKQRDPADGKNRVACGGGYKILLTEAFMG